MLINLKVKTLDAQTHEFCIDNEITVREFKDKVAEKTSISADQQRIIYCGRVMVDDKKLKEYADLDGKVVHVAERPPPSQRLPTSDSSGSVVNNTNERRSRTRPATGGMRNSPLFRALDGMVVGTMAFPMNPNADSQPQVNPFAASSSFCMNRITVARHMLECANNIAAYLEDPSRGLNNQSLDILARGRWTMESTVVEVGITSDIPQSQQIVEMVQDAVQAAFRRNGNANVTLVQLPTVFSSDDNEVNNTAAASGAESINTEFNTGTAEGENPPTSDASIVIEDVDEEEETPTNGQSNNNSTTASSPAVGATAAGDNNENTASSSNDDSNDNSRRRTGTPILATVIEQLRNVQNRLNPFVEQYYDLLQNEPTFEEDDTIGRENAQRLFDRVSEAFHYLSHAQHAISDLMLDVSQATPRYLTCRPILVEQSGYVSSNNFLTPAFIPALRQQQPRNTSNANASTNASTLAAQFMAAAARSAATTASSSNANDATVNSARSGSVSASSTSSSDANNSVVDDPIDEPVVWHPAIDFGTSSSNNNANANTTNNNAATGRGNFQRHVARILQDVVSAASADTEFHVHINTPNVVAIDVPIGVIGSSGVGGVSSGNSSGNRGSQAANTSLNNNDSNSGPTDIATTTTNDNVNTNTTTNSSSPTANPARVTTATLPTTSTQTRSTSRPQVHIGNIPVLGMPTGWNGRVIPNNNVSFDRFLPCNSHHIRELEISNNSTNDNGSNNTTTSAPISTNRNNPSAANVVTNIVTRRPLRSMNFLQRMRTPSSRVIDSTMTNPSRVENSTIPTTVFDFRAARERFLRGTSPESSTLTSTEASNNDASNNSNNTTTSTTRNIVVANITIRQSLGTMNDVLQRMNTSSFRPIGSTMTNLSHVENSTIPTHVFDLRVARERFLRGTSQESSTLTSTEASNNAASNNSNNTTTSTNRNNLVVGSTMANSSHVDNSTIPAPVFEFRVARERFLRASSSGSSTLTSTETSNNTASNCSNNTTQSENRNNPTMDSTTSNAPRAESSAPRAPVFGFRTFPEIQFNDTWPQSSISIPTEPESNQDKQRRNIHTELKNCLNNHIFEGQPINNDTIPPAINRAIQWFGESLLYLPQYEKPEYDSRDSLFNILRSTLPTVFELLIRNPINLKEFEQRLKQICEQFRKRLYSVLYICIGRRNAEIFWVQLMRLLGNSIQTNLRGDVVEFLALYLTPTIPNATDEADAQQFIVLRNSEISNANCVQMPMDTDVEMFEGATTSQPEVDDEPLPSVVPASEAWHHHFPNDWLPIITRDIQRQADNPPGQSPFSDAYIAGMSSKRRKLVQNSKPPTEIRTLIADSVRKAIQNQEHGTSTSVNPTHTPEDVARAIASDIAVHSAYIDAVRTNVRERLRKDPDYEADKFPKSNKFIKK